MNHENRPRLAHGVRRSLRISFGPRPSWALEQLKGIMNTESETRIVRTACLAYYGTVDAYRAHRYMFAGPPGKEPRPLPVMKLELILTLPAEADQATPFERVCIATAQDIQDSRDVQEFTQAADTSEVFGNAILFLYDLLQRGLRNEDVYCRERGKKEFEKLSLSFG